MRKSSPARKTIFFNIRLEPAMHAALTLLAAQNERTVAGEVRAAIKAHLGANGNGRRAR